MMKTNPFGGTRHIAAISFTASVMITGTEGSIERASIVKASACLNICFNPTLNK